jgi:anti-sigma B factor antagonist
MDITTRFEKGVAILELDGKLVHGSGDIRLRGELVDQLDEGQNKILISLEKVKQIDSSGLGELIRCQATATAREAEIKLLKVNLKTYKLLTMTRLIGVFDMFDDEDKAIASFEQ